jgi:transcriptional regulator with XRE-family HTH domain
VWTQEELAERAGVSVRTISDIERGVQRSPRPNTLRRIADALRLADLDAERLAAAGRCSDPNPATPDEARRPPAAPVAVDRAEAALRARAWESASALYSDRVDLLGGEPDPDDAALCDALLGMGDAATMGVQRHVARPAYLRAATAAMTARLHEELLHAAVGYSFMSKAGDAGPRARSVWRRANLRVGDDDLCGRAVLSAASATTELLDNEVELARAHAARALSLARDADDEGALAVAIAASCTTGWGDGRPEQRLHLAVEMEDLDVGWIPVSGLEALELQAVPLLELGRFAEFRDLVDRFAELADPRSPSTVAQVAQWRAAIQLLDGELSAAEQTGRRAAEMAGHPPNFTMGFMAQVYSARHQTRREFEIIDSLEMLVDRHPDELAWRCCLALALARGNRSDEARGLLERIRLEMWPPPAGWTRPLSLALLAEAAAIAQDAEMGAVCEEELLAFDGLFVVPATGTSCEGSVRRYLGFAALARGERGLATERLEHALAVELSTGAPALAGCCRSALAMAAAGSDDR